MEKEKVIGVELGSVFSGQPVVEKYVAKIKSLGVKKVEPCDEVKAVITEKDVPCESLDAAQQFVNEKQKEIDKNLGVVANPYLVFSVNSEDSLLHPCRSVYLKYGIIVPTDFRERVPVILPYKHTAIRYESCCTGLRDVEWLTPGKTPKLNFQYSVYDAVRLPQSWCGKPAKYAFVDCVVFFEEIDFARAFRDEMLMQQALRRYVLYKKIEKTW